MLRASVLVALVTALPLAAGADEDQDLIRQAFDTYKAAVLTADGEGAASVVSKRSLAYYGEMQRVALCESAAAVKERPFVDRLLVVHFRHTAPAETLIAMSDPDAFVFAINHGWIGKESVMDTELGAVTLTSEKRARGKTLHFGEPSGSFPFIRQADGWKVNLLRTLRATGKVIEKASGLRALEQSGGQEELLFNMTEALSGTRPSEQIWEPVAPAAAVCAEGDSPADAG